MKHMTIEPALFNTWRRCVITSNLLAEFCRFEEDSGRLLTEETYEWGAISNLDRFFTKLYRYTFSFNWPLRVQTLINVLHTVII